MNNILLKIFKDLQIDLTFSDSDEHKFCRDDIAFFLPALKIVKGRFFNIIFQWTFENSFLKQIKKYNPSIEES